MHVKCYPFKLPMLISLLETKDKKLLKDYDPLKCFMVSQEFWYSFLHQISLSTPILKTVWKAPSLGRYAEGLHHDSWENYMHLQSVHFFTRDWLNTLQSRDYNNKHPIHVPSLSKVAKISWSVHIYKHTLTGQRTSPKKVFHFWDFEGK